MVIADVTAPLFEEYNGLTGVSIPMAFSAAFAPIAWVVNEVIERIPGLNKLDFNLDDFQKKLGSASLLFEPIVLGTIIGFLVALFAGYPIDPRVGGTTVFSIAVTMGAALVLIPKMASLLMEGLIPIAQASQDFVQKRYEGKGNFYIGLDSAVALGHPLTLALGVIITPLTLLIAVGLSKVGLNGVLPAVDLVVLPFIFIFVVPICKGNGFRALITGILLIVAGLMISTSLAPIFTDVAIMADAASYEGVGLISSICDGANPLTYALVMPFKWIGEAGAVVLLSVISLAAALWNRKRIANI
jgi:PTS system galactitol-specific IIC component